MTDVKPHLNCFKAYDIRGRIPDEFNEDMAYKIGRAYAAFSLCFESMRRQRCAAEQRSYQSVFGAKVWWIRGAT